MYIDTLTAIMKLRKYNQSDISRLAKISRQSVSLWFSSGKSFQNIRVKHLMDLGKALDVSLDELTDQVPVLSDPDKNRELYAEFCWDYLFADIYDFFIALAKRDYKAIGRLVQCRGLYESAYMLGNIIWNDYPRYKKYINHVRQKETYHIWMLHKNQTCH
ncbi:MAG: helix-turn-helix transcriptional regulator [Desulfobacterales bacterium]|nr:helix-turn-helix transcriptional regulator [Desulfobacterales bacterium]